MHANGGSEIDDANAVRTDDSHSGRCRYFRELALRSDPRLDSQFGEP
jgi:hypothetical protein